MRKIFLIIFVLTLNMASVIGDDDKRSVEIFSLIITGNDPEAVKGLVNITEIQTTEVIRLLNHTLKSEEKILDKIFGLIKYILFHLQQSSELDLTLQRIFTSMFNFLLAENKLHSFGMIQLNEYAKLVTRIYTKELFYIHLFMRLSDNKLPSAIRTLVWNNDLKCIKNKKYDEYLFQTPTQLVTGDYSKAKIENYQKFSFNYMLGLGIYQIYNTGCNCSMEELNLTPDGDVIVGILPLGWTNKHTTISWRIELVNDSEFFIINPSTRGKLYAFHEFHVFDDVKYREVFITKKSNVSDVWSFANC